MALRKTPADSDDLILSAEDGRDLFERAAQQWLGMSGAEFLRRYDAGEYRDLPDTPDTWRIMRVESLITFVREIPV